ncbi:Choline-sulfatase [uncultured Pleomorphomonas sp.]|uniref:Choline-sulfatase n=1 Tax=uncultured Pleomorphomonas sp. TaxID=442121 RepID=A0A212LEU2_9HYPH|nr:choline-sulfatase [uncultured Pleomorphomonas sp.]SCM76083.1 Choline-sulfatase [uncultured Pleomorphomonas sp.]
MSDATAKQPNILVLMVDQLSGVFFPDGPADFLRTPRLAALSRRARRFSNCYTASPLCAPSRASFMTGLLPSETGVYDNAAEFRSDMPTFAHRLRGAGYRTILSGKMHFVGPDQLHGFEERLTTDIYPADFGWTPDYEKPEERIDWWYHNLASVTAAGTAEITNQLEYDDEVAFQARARLYDLARRPDDRPWCLTVSFTHPHDPYVARKRFFDLYQDSPALDPAVPPIADEALDVHSRRIRAACDSDSYAIDQATVRRARQAYFANISYIDEQIGSLLDVLESCGLADNTAIVFTADHGDMLGERGLWFKMSFFEGSARVPLMIAAPGLDAGRIDTPVSLVDVAPTLAALAGAPEADIGPGRSLLGDGTPDDHPPVLMEYAGETTVAPMVGIRKGRWKLAVSASDPPLLYDLEADPQELDNRAGDPAAAAVLAELSAEVAATWDLDRFDREVRTSQRRRQAVYAALRKGAYHAWDFQPRTEASERFMRNHLDLNVLEARSRFPR